MEHYYTLIWNNYKTIAFIFSDQSDDEKSEVDSDIEGETE